MVAFPIGQRLTLSPAAIAAASIGAVAGAAVFLMPGSLLERAVLDSGIAAFVPQAEPPLGATARLILAMVAALLVGGLGWLALSFMPVPQMRGFGTLSLAEVLPVLRMGASHPDAPAREPLMAARDLGTPFLEVKTDLAARKANKPRAVARPLPIAPAVPPIERDLPRDLDAPLAAFDPGAIPDEPAKPVPTVPSLAPRKPELDPGERIEVFELARPEPLPVEDRPIAAPKTEATIQALLERLEQGIARRAEAVAPPPPPVRPAPTRERAPQGLEEALRELRRLATI